MIFKVPSNSGSMTLWFYLPFPQVVCEGSPCWGAEVNTILPVIWLLTWRAFAPAWPSCCTAPRKAWLWSVLLFSFHISCHSSNYHFQNYGGSMLHPFHFLLLLLPFIAVFCIEEAWFFPCLLWDICLFNNSLRDIISVIQVLSAWA